MSVNQLVKMVDTGIMRCEETRLFTFTGWLNDDIILPRDLAKAGFFYTGYEDYVQCAFCFQKLHRWQEGHLALVEHERHYPTCQFVQNQKVGNIPIEKHQLIKIMVNYLYIYIL